MSEIAMQAWPQPRLGPGLVAASLACALGAACAAMVAGAEWGRGGAPAPAAVAPGVLHPLPEPMPWLEVIRPIRIFDLEAPQFRQKRLVYAARRLASGDVREDTLAYGPPTGDEPLLRLALRRGADPATRPGLDSALAQLAARQGLAAVLGTRRGRLTTRFGRFETATLKIPARSLPCDGFHLALSAPALSIDGVACGVAHADLACLIDRLDLASAGEDSALVDMFAAAELRRNPACGGTRLGPDAAHATWLDDKPATPARKMHHKTGI